MIAENVIFIKTCTTTNGSTEETERLKYSLKSPHDIGQILKSLQPIVIVLGQQRISFEGNNIIPLTNKAKIYPFIYFSFLVMMYCYSIICNSKNRETLEISITGTSHILTVNALLIVASSIFSSVIQNSNINFKLAQNVKYFDNKLKIPFYWYQKACFRVKIGYFLYVFFYANLIFWDVVVWRTLEIFRIFVIYIILLNGEMIVFQYLFDIWIVVNRLKVLNSQLIDLVQPILCHGNSDVVIDMDYLSNDVSTENTKSEEIKVHENFESGIIRLMSVYDTLGDNIAIINYVYGMQVRNISTRAYLTCKV